MQRVARCKRKSYARSNRGRQLPEGARQPDPREHCLRLVAGEGPVLRIEPVAVPGAGEIPCLREPERTASRPPPLLAPSLDVLLRPEQQHGPSGEGDVLVPVLGGNGDVDDAFSGLESPATHDELHRKPAAAATR